MSKCKQCGTTMNPVAVMLGPVCGKCVRENHKTAAS
jgi:NMD protein affecting ribosome stability and mRNA decay